MRWLRSFPSPVPDHRAHVVDDMERIWLRDYDYSPLADVDDDVCLLEWDMALSREDRAAFEDTARMTPSGVVVAPYRLYNPGVPPSWAHRWVSAEGRECWLTTGEPHCRLFGFGLVYLPRKLVRAFLGAPAPERGRPPWVQPGNYADCRMTDQTFSIWHCFRSQPGSMQQVRVAWHVSPVHLHY